MRLPARVVASFAAIVAITVAVPIGASAQTIGGLRAQAARIEAQIQANGDRIAALGEQYNGAVLHLQELQTSQARATAQLQAVQRRAQALHTSAAALAARVYMSSSGGSTVVQAVDVANTNQLARSQMYSAAVSSRNADIFGRLHAAQVELGARRKSLATAAGAARAQADQLSANRQQIEAANVTQTRLLAQTTGELGRLVRAEEQRQLAAQRAAARARAAADAAAAAARRAQVVQAPSSGPSPQGPGTPLPPAPPPSGDVAKVIAYARAQLGKSYVYNTAGPDTFDCSGLTMMAWAQAGVSMPHYSGAQFSMFPHVALSDLQPGDLVFKGPGGSTHVALYVGGGMQIAATHTGSYVLLQPVDYPGLSGAVRP